MKQVIKTLVNILICNIAFLGIAFLVSRIPYSWIEDNVRESATYFNMIGTHAYTSDVVVFELADRNQIDVASRMNSFEDAVTCPWNDHDHDPSKKSGIMTDDNIVSYGRYWHGTPMLLRFMLIFFSIQEIRVLVVVLFILVSGLVVFSLMKKIGVKASIAYAVGVVCAESYGNAYIVMTFITWLLSSVCLLLVLYGRNINFAVVGSLGVFLDFMGCETLSFTMPMAVAIMLGVAGTYKEQVKKAIQWGSGFLLTWCFKFLICYVTGNWESVQKGFSNRTQLFTANIFTDILNSLYFNIRFTTPLKFFSQWQVVLLILGVFTAFMVWRYRSLAKPYILILAVPLLRFIVLSNHSLEHCFFMYRSLEPVFFILAYCILIKERKYKLGIAMFK